MVSTSSRGGTQQIMGWLYIPQASCDMLVSCCPSLLEEPLSLRRFLSVLLALAPICFAPPLLSAQSSWSLRPEDPEVQVFGGYSAYRAGGKLNGVTLPDFTNGWASQFIINTNHWVGFVADFNGHYNSAASAHNFALGVRFQRPLWRVVPFGEALLGVQRLTPKGSPGQNSPAYNLGAGLDVKVNSRFSVRPFQLSYVGTNYTAASSATGQSDTFKGVRVQAGLLYNIALVSLEGDVIAACSAEPTTVDSGGVVKIAVTPKGFQPKRILSYSYATTAGTVAGNEAAASVDTTGVKPGTYAVTAKVVDNGKRKHQQTASCKASFIVNAVHPPTLSVSADPASIKPGDSSTITARGRSQDNRPLSYSCAADGGQLSGSGPTYTLDASGVPEGKVTVTCKVTDDRRLVASASTSVEIAIPAVAPPPPAQAAAPAAAAVQPSRFGAIEFKRDTKRPTRVDNEAKGELDRYADALAATPDVKGALVGFAAPTDARDRAKRRAIAGQRAVNTKDYLSKEKGVDAKRIQPRTGSGNGQKVELWLLPPGSVFTAKGSAVVDETIVKAVPRVALKARKPRGKPNKKVHK